MEKIESRLVSAVDRGAQVLLSNERSSEEYPADAPRSKDIPDHPLDWPIPTD